MRVDGIHTRSIWLEPDGPSIGIIDQTLLPHRYVAARLHTLDDAARAIATMQVRGAPLIGATAAYGICLALRADASDQALEQAYSALLATRPTAINLKWALDEMMAAVRNRPREDRVDVAYRRAAEICDEDVAINQAIGRNGLALIERIAARKRPGERVNLLTHCNAGWLATVDWGTATAPVYMAHDKGIPVHVWADETRPRNQGASLTAYLKALAAHDNGVPFYVALPSPTIDFTVANGLAEIPIEQRSADEVATMTGRTQDGRIETVRIVPDGSAVANYAFDVTPARLVTGLITERGVLSPSRDALAAAFPERVGEPRSRSAAE
jgi:methylthioribose-1-phosphate isomerase